MTDVTKCKHWRWLPGMLTTDGRRCIEALESGAEFERWYSVRWVEVEALRTLTPDLTDPATLGCLIHLVREAWTPNVVVFGGWRAVHIYAPTATRQWVEGDLAPYVWESDGMGEAKALVAALEAAP